MLLARLLGPLHMYWHREGNQSYARAWTAEVLASGDTTGALDPLVTGLVYLGAGFLDFDRREPVEARRRWEVALDHFRRAGSERYVGFTLANLPGTFIGDDSAYDTAMALGREGVEIGRRRGESVTVAQGLNALGEVARVHDAMEDARALYEEGLELTRRGGDRAHATVFAANLVYVAMHRGDTEAALRLGRETLRECHALGRRLMAAWCVSELGAVELELGRPDRGARMVGAADAAMQVLGGDRYPGDQPAHDRVVARLRETLGSERFDECYREGGRLTLDEIVAQALAD